MSTPFVGQARNGSKQRDIVTFRQSQVLFAMPVCCLDDRCASAGSSCSESSMVWITANGTQPGIHFCPTRIQSKQLPEKRPTNWHCKKNLAAERNDVPLLEPFRAWPNKKAWTSNLAHWRRCASGHSIVLLGSGSTAFEKGYQKLALRFPARLRCGWAYNEGLAHRIERHDFYLMPSLFERAD